VVADGPEPVRRLPRALRREQILTAATEASARSGFAATGLEDIAAEAGITRVILYRHFDSKTDLLAAAESPAGFRLLFQHAPREASPTPPGPLPGSGRRSAASSAPRPPPMRTAPFLTARQWEDQHHHEYI
jgi:AcrR family transcriptional regulator